MQILLDISTAAVTASHIELLVDIIIGYQWKKKGVYYVYWF